jgi:hypothetical protein
MGPQQQGWVALGAGRWAGRGSRCGSRSSAAAVARSSASPLPAYPPPVPPPAAAAERGTVQVPYLHITACGASMQAQLL